jgi:hypothetical protein
MNTEFAVEYILNIKALHGMTAQVCFTSMEKAAKGIPSLQRVLESDSMVPTQAG